MFKKIKELFSLSNSITDKEVKLKLLNEELDKKEQMKAEVIAQAKKDAEKEYSQLANKTESKANELKQTEETLILKTKELERLEKGIKKVKTESVGIKQLIDKFPDAVDFNQIEKELSILEEALGDGVLNNLVELNLHHNDSKLLRKEMSTNNREITKLLKTYEARYSTKANKTIYHLMVIGLKAELQNILYKLKYTNLDKSQEDAKALINKYLTICGDGNANILPTITRFLSELDPLFQNAIQIEYKYYIQKEKEKEEQRRIKEQMKLEAEERKMLEEEKKKIEKEEEKYKAED
ncbi:hypothetical protein JCM9140_4854 [Halalkalibacter wakoensis JCM 9140]|uniref:Uncharacterized protein n=1 Tax=Halalkalibacter wakoensis JCM 9140 TaxID=1236970 RepID=W4QB44_9BACI|nr:hypothetical protein [Halalkalibacter wakoensis]GAE28604.1 hypothetical protein JCM9140_4854 [Halalkalibacter wakoensis JCM 9140]